jgi:hypothetical protein
LPFWKIGVTEDVVGMAVKSFGNGMNRVEALVEAIEYKRKRLWRPSIHHQLTTSIFSSLILFSLVLFASHLLSITVIF